MKVMGLLPEEQAAHFSYFLPQFTIGHSKEYVPTVAQSEGSIKTTPPNGQR
jgi:hypothetical protein